MIEFRVVEVAYTKKQRGRFFDIEELPDFAGRGEVFKSPWTYTDDVRRYFQAGATRVEGQKLADGTRLKAESLTAVERDHEERFVYESTAAEVWLTATAETARKLNGEGKKALIKRANSVSQFNGAAYAPNAWVDIDEEGDLEKARHNALKVAALLVDSGVQETELGIRFSGSKGFHVLFPIQHLGLDLFVPMPVRILSDRMKTVMTTLFPFTDARVYLATQLLRVVNTRHAKTGLFCIPLAFHELRDSSVADIRQLAASPREISCTARVGEGRES